MNEKKYRRWNRSVIVYSETQNINVLDNCFAYMFTNVGDTIAKVDGMIIFPSPTPLTDLGDSRSIMAHEGEVLAANQIVLSFGVPLGANPRVEVVQLQYIKEEQ